jgi:nucleotide-binding universal stress UspA family protein
MALRRIVVAVDFSERSLPALRLARWLAGSLGGELVAVHAAPSARGDERDELGRLLGELQPGVPLRARILRGEPAPAIVACADEERADLIVLGTRPRAGLADFILGSVAMRVMALAACPVVSVRPDARLPGDAAGSS